MTDPNWEEVCYGCTQEQSRAGIDKSVEFYSVGLSAAGTNMALGSILSDAQELIEMGRTEQARQYLNRVKDAIFNAAPIVLWRTRE